MENLLKIQSYKNRSIDTSLPVEVYKNLHNGLWSIRQQGRIIGHASQLILDNVRFKISEAGRQRVIASGHKNVHAVVIGRLVINDIASPNNGEIIDYQQISYNPFKYGFFYFKDSLTPALLNPDTLLYFTHDALFAKVKSK